jgi:hypothetical protein
VRSLLIRAKWYRTTLCANRKSGPSEGSLTRRRQRFILLIFAVRSFFLGAAAVLLTLVLFSGCFLYVR